MSAPHVDEAAPKPLAGIRVLDLSRILAGPLATQTLADLGATVIKVEKPGTGDETRQWGPPFVTTLAGERGDAAYFFSCNRGKRSVTVDFTTDEGREIVRRLACKSDVLVENYKVGGLKPYGLDPQSLRALHSSLIYCSITGFGQDGPDAARPGYDALIQALGGLMSITGEPDGSPGGGPQKVGVAVVDVIAGVYASNAILAALFTRERTGVGSHIDISLLDAQVAALVNQASNWLLTGKLPTRIGSAHPSIVPYQPFPCRDGYVMIAVGNDTQFAALCRALGCPELAQDRRFSCNAARVEYRIELIEHLGSRVRTLSTDQCIALGVQQGFPCGPINTLDKVFANPQVRARGLVSELESPRYGPLKTVVSPMRFDGRAACARSAPPELGGSTVEVLAELGYSQSCIETFRRSGVI